VTLLLIALISCSAVRGEKVKQSATASSAATKTDRQLAVIVKHRNATARCRAQFDLATPRVSALAKRTNSTAYLHHVAGKWLERRVACRKMANRRLPVIRTLKRGLDTLPYLRGLEHEFERAGWQGKMSPYFLVGASWESGMAAVPCSANRFNIWGVGACGRNWNEPKWATREIAIRSYVAFVRSTWPSARTCYQLSGYCPPCGTYGWGSRTHSQMRQLFGPVSASLAYPR